MRRRDLLAAAAALSLAAPLGARALPRAAAPSVDELPPLSGALTVYLGRGEGGLYEDVLDAIRERNPDLALRVRRGPAAALANTIVAESRAGVRRADVFWSVDAGSLGVVAAADLAREIPEDIRRQLRPEFRYRHWAAISGRVRSLPYHPGRITRERIPRSVMAFAESDLRIGWAPAYASFQSFVTAMRLLEGDAATRDWLRALKSRARSYAGELGVVLGVSRGQVDIGFANHYYTLRMKEGQPDAAVQLAFTRNDAGSLLNASGALLLGKSELGADFLRYLLTREAQSYLAREAFEIPMASGVAMPEGLPPLTEIAPPALDLTRLADLEPTLALMREAGVL